MLGIERTSVNLLFEKYFDLLKTKLVNHVFGKENKNISTINNTLMKLFHYPLKWNKPMKLLIVAGRLNQTDRESLHTHCVVHWDEIIEMP